MFTFLDIPLPSLFRFGIVGDLNGKNKIHQSKFKAISSSLKLPGQKAAKSRLTVKRR